MNEDFHPRPCRWPPPAFWPRALWRASVLLLTWLLISSGAQAQTAEALRAKYATLESALRQNQFGRPLTLDSSESSSGARGEIHALVNYPFAVVSAALNNPEHWCDVMLLHINTKYCHAQIAANGTQLRMYLGKKTPEPLSAASRLDFRYNALAANAGYLAITLNAPQGPMGTSDYRILLEAVAPVNGSGKTFLHLSYSYATNFSGRLAMLVYLKTVGNGKVGFSSNGKPGSGNNSNNDKMNYIAGIRGLVERNTMRYYLAIDSFLEAGSAVPAAQFDARLQSWFTAVERYPLQLHEMDRETYIAMKHDENLRQQTLQ